MKTIDQLIKEYYTKFEGLPNGNPIVRHNQLNDAFEIVVLETLYGKELGIDVSKMNSNNINVLSKYIVSPPDDGIDIVIEHEDIDGNRYDFIQVKNTDLSPLEMEQTVDYMEKSVLKYMKNPQNVGKNLRGILSSTNLSSGDKNNCKYILVHTGIDNFYKGQKLSKTQIITATELEVIRNAANVDIPRVTMEQFKSDSFNNFILYEEAKEDPAILLNIRGYDLANLAVKYTNTSLGRNILFGQNLRESLSKSNTYEGMEKTIRTEPEKFWFYNNGITIIAEDFSIGKSSDNSKVDNITLKRFSIINGAQTTSALGKFLKNAKMNQSNDDIEQLKKVYVLTRILKVTNPEFKSRISIYNNTQNPITTRDMASNREEQLQLHNRLLSGNDPHIYVEIRRGMNPPTDIKLYKHQFTTNEELAQLAYAGFKRDPFTAKDKKNSIFDTDYKQNQYVINQNYHEIFHYNFEESEGILFIKSKEEINELLFVNYLYKETKKELIKTYKKRISDLQEKNDTISDKTEIEKNEKRIADYEKLKAICNICSLYCLTYYYCFKNEFLSLDANKIYRYEEFYSDNNQKQIFVNEFRDCFLSPTIQIIKELTINNPNLNTWIRDKKSTPVFLDKVGEKIESDISLEAKYDEYIKQLKK